MTPQGAPLAWMEMDRPAFIIAELSANHGQQLEKALALVDAAAAAGADAVKIQTYTPDTLTLDCASAPFLIGKGTIWENRTLYDLYAEAMTPWAWHAPIKERVEALGLTFFSTPFDDSAVTFLEELGVGLYKIASFELVDLPLIRRVAATRKPIIMSTGMGSAEEIEEAVTAAREAGNRELALLKCTSAYPAPLESMNLVTIPHMAARFKAPVGLSDHTLGSTAPVAAVSLGARIIEKHLTLKRDEGGPDAAFSLEPDEFKAMVGQIRAVEKVLGKVSYEVTPAEAASRAFRRSLFAVADVAMGEPFSARNVRSIRPGMGLHPRYLDQILASVAARAIPRGTPLSWSDVVR